MRRADRLSKPVDPTDCLLSRYYVHAQIARRARDALPGSETWPPAVDLIASARASQRCCGCYYAAVWDWRCAAADAFLLDWAAVPGSYPPRRPQRRPLTFTFPPLKLLRQLLAKVANNEAYMWLVCPQEQYLLELHALSKLPVRFSWNL